MVLKPMREIPFSLEDFPQFSSPEVGLAVLGHPISHSISPILHNAALRLLAKSEPAFLKWSYERLDVRPENLSDALHRLAKAGFRGINLTIPHKVEVLNLLDTLDEEAAVMGAVNTLILHGQRWHGYNTDGYGLQMAVERELECEFKNSNVLILGAGGAARAAAVQALVSGAKRVHVHNRSLSSLNELLGILNRKFNSRNTTGSTASCVAETEFIGQDWIVINATPLGLNKKDISPLFMPSAKFGKNSVFYDMIYNPKQTCYLAEAAAGGFKNANGLSMLVYQAARALEIWTEKDISAQAMFKAAHKYLESNQ